MTTTETVPTIAERVAAGAAYLDRHMPTWVDVIDLDRLDLGDPCGCVMGQLVTYETPDPLAWTDEEYDPLIDLRDGDDEWEDAYQAWSEGIVEPVPSLGHEEQRSHGFHSYATGELRRAYEFGLLTAEWRRVIEARR